MTAFYSASMYENWQFCEHLLHVSDSLILHEHNSQVGLYYLPISPFLPAPHEHSRISLPRRAGTLISKPQICHLSVKSRDAFCHKMTCFKGNIPRSFKFLLQGVKTLLHFLCSFSSVELSCKKFCAKLCVINHITRWGRCIYICMHLYIFSNRTNQQLLNRCISASAYANLNYSPQVLVKIACKRLRTHFLFPVFLLVRDVLRVLLIVSCTGRDVRTLPTHIAKQSYFCARERRASLSLHFPRNTNVTVKNGQRIVSTSSKETKKEKLAIL